MEDLPPFENKQSLSDLLSHLQRNEIQEDIKKLLVASAVQEEWRNTVTADIKGLKSDMSEVKDLASRYKGGIFLILGLTGAAAAIFALWDHIIKAFH